MHRIRCCSSSLLTLIRLIPNNSHPLLLGSGLILQFTQWTFWSKLRSLDRYHICWTLIKLILRAAFWIYDSLVQFSIISDLLRNLTQFLSNNLFEFPLSNLSFHLQLFRIDNFWIFGQTTATLVARFYQVLARMMANYRLNSFYSWRSSMNDHWQVFLNFHPLVHLVIVEPSSNTQSL